MKIGTPVSVRFTNYDSVFEVDPNGGVSSVGRSVGRRGSGGCTRRRMRSGSARRLSDRLAGGASKVSAPPRRD